MLPKSWDDITLNKFIEICSIEGLIKDPIDKEVRIIAALSGKTIESIENLKITEISKLASGLKFMQTLPSEKKIKTSFRFEGHVYKACILFSDMKAGQFIDFSTICKDVKPEDMIHQAANLVGAMVQRRKYQMTYPFLVHEYVGYDKTNFGEMPMSQIYPYYVFFCNVLTNLYKDIESSSIKKVKKQTKKIKRLLRKDRDLRSIGDGFAL